MPWHNVRQTQSDPPDLCQCCGLSWMELRNGKVTGSKKRLGVIMANYPKAFGEPAKRLAAEFAVHQLGGEMTQDDYTNGHMERGTEQEPIARALYSDEYFVDVANGGFYDNGLTGCSPDGLVGSDGLIEIKSVINPQHYECIKRNSLDPAYKWQVIFNLRESNRVDPRRVWIDYVSFCATFPKEHQRLFVCRVNIDAVQHEFKQIDERLFQFWMEVESIKRDIVKSKQRAA